MVEKKKTGFSIRERKILLFIMGLLIGTIFVGIIGGVVDTYVADVIYIGKIPFSTDRAIWVLAPVILTAILFLFGIKSKFDTD